MSHPTVELGQTTYTIAPFSPFKFLEVTEAVARILERVKDSRGGVDKYVDAYRERNLHRMSRAEYESMGGTEISDEAWQASGNELVLHNTPSTEQLIAEFGPLVYKDARPEVERLICLIVIPNSELEAADLDGDTLESTGELMRKWRKVVLHDATFGQAINAFGAAFEAVKAESEVVGQGPLGDAMRWLQATAKARMDAATGQPQETEPSSDAPPSSNDSRTSSPDGPASKSSTGSRGGSSRRSARKPASVS
jgi:hypothetical protein